ncbi:MAG: sulfatase-like hydrolase/transferase [Planctomycetaceae bacterium]|nr:sulfatase-like hydrolase/transferase [Planctomycetaceae bacterium]
MRLRLLVSSCLYAAVCLGSAAHAADATRPNIILIFSDDYGIPGVGSYGSRYATPNLDALAKGGIRFEHCFSMPLCGPSRAVTLSGRYPFRNGVVSNGHGTAYKPGDSPSIAKLLQQSGYATAVAGKWRQLQYFDTVEDSKAWGFDEFIVWGFGDEGKGERYWQPSYNKNGTFLTNVDDKYGPDLLHEFVVDFIRKNQKGPFFVYYPTPLVHGPIMHTPDSPNKDGKGDQHYAENVAYLDKLVGKLVAELEQQGLRKNTLIVFTGDNGSVGGEERLTMANGRRLIGQKGTMKEGGSRVPLIVNWPGVTPAGKVLPDLVDFSDFYVTFAEVAGARLPEGLKLDGRSFAPQIRGEKGQPREFAFVQLHDEWYARNQQWKLTQAGDLFSMKDAPFDEIAVAKDSPDAAAKAARTQLQAALDELNPAGGKTAVKGEKSKKKAKKKAKAAA